MYAFENAGDRSKIKRFQSIKSLTTIAKHSSISILCLKGQKQIQNSTKINIINLKL